MSARDRYRPWFRPDPYVGFYADAFVWLDELRVEALLHDLVWRAVTDTLPCPYDPSPLVGVPLGMFHCPACGNMVVAGIHHPDYRLPEHGGPTPPTPSYLPDDDDDLPFP